MSEFGHWVEPLVDMQPPPEQETDAETARHGKASRTPELAIARNCGSGAIRPLQARVGQSADSRPKSFAQESRDPLGYSEVPLGEVVLGTGSERSGNRGNVRRIAGR